MVESIKCVDVLADPGREGAECGRGIGGQHSIVPMDAEGCSGGRMKRPVVVEDLLRESRERGSSRGGCQGRCLCTGRESHGEKHSRRLVASGGPNRPDPIIYAQICV